MKSPEWTFNSVVCKRQRPVSIAKLVCYQQLRARAAAWVEESTLAAIRCGDEPRSPAKRTSSLASEAQSAELNDSIYFTPWEDCMCTPMALESS